MTTYTTISGALVAVGAKPFATTVQALRDNPLAIAEGTTGAPVVAAGWVPYGKVTAGDANTGLIYSFAVSGAVATVTSPDFVDGWEYAFLLDRISVNNSANSIRVNFYRETAAAYAGTMNITGATVATTYSGFIIVNSARRSLHGHAFTYATLVDSAASITPASQSGELTVAHGATRDKILRAQFSPPTANFLGGDIYMFKRRDYSA